MAVELATAALRDRFRNREDVLVALDLVVHYEARNNTLRLRPGQDRAETGHRRRGKRAPIGEAALKPR